MGMGLQKEGASVSVVVVLFVAVVVVPVVVAVGSLHPWTRDTIIKAIIAVSLVFITIHF